MIETLPEDIDGVITRLGGIIDRSIEEASPVGYFAAVYRTVTQTIRDEIAKGAAPRGAFEDVDRMTRFDVVFANRFISAHDAWRKEGSVTSSWQLAFETAEAEREAVARGSRFGRLPVLVHLLLGVNAHMNLDLGCAASEIAPGADFADLRDDFEAINAVLATLVPRERLAEERVAPLERLVDRWHWLSGHVIDLDIDVRREDSWRFAESIAPLEGAARDTGIASRDRHVHGQGTRLLSYVQDRFWASPKHLVFRPLILLDSWTTRSTADVIRSFAS